MKAFVRLGWTVARVSGSHHILEASGRATLTIPVHKGRTPGTDFQIHRHGGDPRFAGSSLRVPANALRDRAADVLAPEALAERHHAYRLRVMIGPTYRGDLRAALEEAPDLTAAELARRTYASFATACPSASPSDSSETRRALPTEPAAD